MACTYEAFFNSARKTITADSLWQAQQKAVEAFKPRKSQLGLVSVVLVDNGKGPVALNNSNADFG
jgi:hypothetical protein